MAQWIFLARGDLVVPAFIAAVAASCGGGGGDTGATTADAPTPLPSASTSPAPAGISLATYGGVCDGRTDNAEAIARGIADTKTKGVALLIPAGQCNFSTVIKLDSAKISGSGPTSVLYATNWHAASIFMYGNAPSVTNVKLTGVAAPGRQSAWESTKIMVLGASDFVIDSVTIDGAPAASIQVAKNASRGTVTNNRISNSLADSIHMTDGANAITVSGNVIENSGDDGIAVVSYGSDANDVNNITATNNVVRGNRWGRTMSVVGARNVVYENNLLQDNPNAACLYVAQERGYNSKGSDTITLRRNTLENCGGGLRGHAAIMVYSDGQATINNVVIDSNWVRQHGQPGIRLASRWVIGAKVLNNKTEGANPPLAVSAPGTIVTPYTSGPVGRESH